MKKRKRNKPNFRKNSRSKIVKSELNGKTSNFAANPVPFAGALFLINGIAQGTDFFERIATTVVLKTIQLKMVFRVSQASQVLSTVYSMDLIWDFQANGVAPAITDIYDSISPFSFRALATRRRFRVLYSTGPFILGEASSPNQPDSFAWQVFINLKAQTTYEGGSNLIASLGTGACWIVIRTDGVTPQVLHSFSGESRVRYTEGQVVQSTFGAAIQKGGQQVLGANTK